MHANYIAKAQKKSTQQFSFFVGGCANFGHSCYGGMGKRASNGDLYDTNEEVLQNGFQDAEENPAFVFTGPRSSYQPKPKLTPQQYDNISRIIKSWV